jgi:hypothetical protein
MRTIHTSHIQQGGFASIQVMLLAVIVVVVLAFVVHFISHAGHTSTTNNSSTSATTTPSGTTAPTTTSDVYTTLSPATVPSKTAECTQTITFASNGNSGPVTCSNGELNVTEWNALSGIEPTVMTLGYSPTVSQVQSALCSDANASDSDANTNNSHAIEATVYQITALYYGWNFSPSPTAVLSNGTC